VEVKVVEREADHGKNWQRMNTWGESWFQIEALQLLPSLDGQRSSIDKSSNNKYYSRPTDNEGRW